jgi:hypothetical protein
MQLSWSILYNEVMARGWESKSIEAQIELANSEPFQNSEQQPSAVERQALIKRRDLMLSRRRILQQLESGPNERYSQLLRRTLAGLDAEIAALN